MMPSRPALLALLLVCLVPPLSSAENPKATTKTTTTEASALAVLGSTAEVHAKARACQELAVLGGPASVSALAALLDDEHLSDYARSGLEGIRDPAAGAALRAALPKLEGRMLVGVIMSLGVRRDKAAVPELRALALDPKRHVGPEAIATLGMIGTAEAAKILEQFLAKGRADSRMPAAHAALTAAEHLAQEGSAPVARDLLNAIVRANPSTDLNNIAQRQAAMLAASR